MSGGLKNIGNFYESGDLFYIFTAVLIIDILVIFVSRYFPDIFGCSINKWYSDFGLVAVISDVGIIVIGFLIARLIYTNFIQKSYGWSPLIFIGLLVLVQAVHDILFYLGVILPMPLGHNAIIDLLKGYSQSGGVLPIIADSAMMIGSALIAMALKGYDTSIVSSVLTLALYTMTYVIFTRPVNKVCKA
jgi:hypothetical protein